MIDEALFFSMGNVAAPQAVEAWLREMDLRISKPFALLLTEVERPEPLAAEVRQALEAYAGPLRRLVAQHEQMLAEWRRDNPDYDQKLAAFRKTGISGPEAKRRFFELRPPPFPYERTALDNGLASIAERRSNCDRRLAARLNDKAAGTARRSADAAEEPDPIAQIWANRLRGELDVHKQALDQRALMEEHMRRLIAIRSKKKP